MHISESELEDYLIEEWDSLELIKDEKLKLIGRQFQLWNHGPRIDILAKRPNGNLLVIELKARSLTSEALEQVLYYKHLLTMIYSYIDPKDKQRTIDCMLIGDGLAGTRIGCALPAAGVFFVHYSEGLGLLPIGRNWVIDNNILTQIGDLTQKILQAKKERGNK